ncbi:MAG TPA: hypothetical protein VNO33_09070 [Kofleriaceae bacterium]|nr:hypothetical protein [Kofleriaceae bacterium]
MRCGEWVGGIVSFPSYVTGEGEPYRPAALLWVEVDSGLIVGTQLVRPDRALDTAAASFTEAAREPHAGAARVPERVRVATPELFEALVDRIGDVEVVLGPTPELDPVIASMRAHMRREQDGADEEVHYVQGDVSADDVARMFRAAARFYQLQPWRIFPADGFAWVSCELLGIVDGALCVVGQMGESFGFALFRSVEAAVAFTEAAEANDRGRAAAIPEHLMFSYDDRATIGPALAAEIDAHGWQIAGPRAYPSWQIVDTDRLSRPLARIELAGTTAIIEMFCRLIEFQPALAEAWAGGEPCEESSVVETGLGEVAVEVAAPLWMQSSREVRGIEILTRFGQWPDAAVEHLEWAEMLLEYADDYHDSSLEELTPEVLDELLFETIPRKVSVEADAAPQIVEAVRALLGFGARELGSESAARCLESLRPDAVKRLARELADPDNFGPAKSLFMEGARAGYDVHTQAGMDAWIAVVQRRMANERPRSPERHVTSSQSTSARNKSKRKAARAARKRRRH